VADKHEPGKHGHKESEEPSSQTKSQSRQHSESSSEGRQQFGGQQSREEHGLHGRQQAGSSDRGRQSSQPAPTSEEGRQAGTGKGSGAHTEEQDLKQREQRDKQGNVHHHTRSSQEQKDRKAG